jgi:hypothetical protein
MRIALTATALLMTACSPAGLPAASLTSASPTPAAVATSATPTAVPSTPTVAASPSPTVAAPTLEALLRPLVATWRPSEPVLLVERPEGEDLTLIAVPVAGAPAKPLVTIHQQGFPLGYALRDDGSMLAVAIPIVPGTSRIAVLDFASGTRRWLTDEEPDVQQATPVWAADGAFLYYAAQSYLSTGITDHGIFRIRSDGSEKTRVRSPEQNGAALRGLTPDGRGLVWARLREGGAVEVLDLVSGQNRSFDESTAANALSWRRAQPRALVMVGGCCGGPPGGSLALWDDVLGSSTMLLGVQSTPPLGVIAASWEPGGQRFAATVIPRTSNRFDTSVFVYDAAGRQLSAVADTERAQQILWLPMGIVFARATTAPPSGSTEILLVQAAGGLPVSLYRDASYVFINSVVGP